MGSSQVTMRTACARSGTRASPRAWWTCRPEGPVTRTRPRGRMTSSLHTEGRRRSSRVGTTVGMRCQTIVMFPRCTAAFTRRRAPSSEQESRGSVAAAKRSFLLGARHLAVEARQVLGVERRPVLRRYELPGDAQIGGAPPSGARPRRRTGRPGVGASADLVAAAARWALVMGAFCVEPSSTGASICCPPRQEAAAEAARRDQVYQKRYADSVPVRKLTGKRGRRQTD